MIAVKCAVAAAMRTGFTMANMTDASSMAKIYLAGILVNLVHATAGFITMLLFSKPLLEKLSRIKTKYGMMEDEL